MIAFQNVSLAYQTGHYALEDVSFELKSGSFTFLTGHSGAGKSSLLRLVARLEKPTEGDIRVGDVHYSTLNSRQEPKLRRQMGIVFQDNQLLYDRSVFDNVALPLIIGSYRFKDIKTRVMAALERVGLADRYADDPIGLSGGEQQRVGIARAVVARPKLLLADEPTGNLDAEISEEIMKLLLQFNASGVSVLFATHDRELLSSFKFPKLVLNGGRISNATDQALRTNTAQQTPSKEPIP